MLQVTQIENFGTGTSCGKQQLKNKISLLIFFFIPQNLQNHKTSKTQKTKTSKTTKPLKPQNPKNHKKSVEPPKSKKSVEPVQQQKNKFTFSISSTITVNNQQKVKYTITFLLLRKLMLQTTRPMEQTQFDSLISNIKKYIEAPKSKSFRSEHKIFSILQSYIDNETQEQIPDISIEQIDELIQLIADQQFSPLLMDFKLLLQKTRDKIQIYPSSQYQIKVQNETFTLYRMQQQKFNTMYNQLIKNKTKAGDILEYLKPNNADISIPQLNMFIALYKTETTNKKQLITKLQFINNHTVRDKQEDDNIINEKQFIYYSTGTMLFFTGMKIDKVKATFDDLTGLESPTFGEKQFVQMYKDTIGFQEEGVDKQKYIHNFLYILIRPTQSIRLGFDKVLK
ncbi:Conserved_hypothetical protein [Hexamita inflata]|uniref:Uncharacterized protein n=1 Tax=Hexamita inflata TaxID=28002 RepID=A0ABP1H1B9_9EUKA